MACLNSHQWGIAKLFFKLLNHKAFIDGGSIFKLPNERKNFNKYN